MAEIDTSARDAAKSQGMPTKKRRRVPVRIDMTPMVDIAFLLLIFFMVTTVFRQPLAMEVNLPESDATVEVPESNVLTILVDEADSLHTRLGTDDWQSESWDQLPELFRSEGAANPELIVLVKIHRSARYEDMVDMMDALEDAHMERFSLIPMSDVDLKTLEGLR